MLQRKMQILIGWLRKKPTDMDHHWFNRATSADSAQISHIAGAVSNRRFHSYRLGKGLASSSR